LERYLAEFNIYGRLGGIVVYYRLEKFPV